MKKMIVAGLLPILVACGQVTDSKKSELKDIVPGAGVAALLGTGYDSHTESFTSVCAESRFPNDKIRYSGAPTASIQLDRSLTYEELKNLLDVQVSGKLNIEGLNIKSAAKFASEAASSNLSTSLIFSNKIGGRYVLINQPTLSADAVKIGKSEDAIKIRAQCGDQYVDQIELGAELFVLMRFDFANQDVKSNFEAEIDLDFVNIFQVSGAAKVAMEKYKNTVGVTVTALQIGGDQTLLSRIFQDRVGDTSDVLRCSIDSINECIETMENVVAYASSSKAGSFPDQLKNMKFDDASPTGPAFLRYITKSYFNAGMQDLYSKPAPLIAQEIVEARTRILDKYEVQSRDRRRVSSFLNLRLSPAEREKYTALDALIGSNIKLMVDAAKICYDTPSACIEAEHALKLQTYSQEDLARTLEFFDFCVTRRENTSSAKTVDALRAFLGAGPGIPCDELETDLKNELSLDLSNKGISDLRPLNGLNQLVVLNLSSNAVRNIDPLVNFSKLRTLNLRKNVLSNIQQIAKLRNLENLDLAYNRLIDASPIQDLKSLRTLKLHGNDQINASIFDPENFDTLYLNSAQICAFERGYALKKGLISEAQYKAYSQSNFGPLYEVPGDHNSPLQRFLLCSAVTSAF